MASTTIRGVTVQLGGDTSGLKKALSDVNKEISNTSKQLKDVEKLLKLDPKNTELLRQKQQLLSNQIQETKTKLDALKQAEADMKSNGVDQNSEQFQALEREIISTEQRLQSLETEYRNFGSVTAQQIAVVGQQMKDLGSKISDTGEKMTKTLTLPIVAAGTAAVTKYAEVDKTMTLANQTMKNTEEEAELLNQAMSEAAANSTFGMNDAATAVLNFARAGLDAKEAAEALAPAMNLAAGEGGDLDTVSAGLVATINGFGDTFDKAAEYADVFAAACNNSALDVNSLSDAMSVAAPIFRAAGYNVKDAALYMGTMANAGIDASTAANSLKTGMARLAKPPKEAREALEKLNLELFNADGTMKDSVEVQKLLHDSFANLTEQEQLAAASAIFGKNNMSSWLALINTAPQEVNELSESLHGAAGTTEEMAEAMMSGFGGSIEKLKSSLDVLMTNLGRLIATYIQPVIDKIQQLVDKFMSLDEGTKKTIVTILGIVAAAGPLLIIIGKVISSIGSILTLVPKIVSAVSTVATGVSSLFSIIAANPVLLIIAAIVAAVVAATILIIKNLDSIKAWMAAFEEWMKAVANSIATAFTDGFNAIKNGFVTAFNAVLSFFKGIINNILSGIENVVNRAISYLNSLINICNSVVGAIMNIIGWAYSGINEISMVRLPRMASGGILNYGSAIVGEEGPELLTMRGNKAQVTPLTATLDRNSLAAITAGSKTSSNTNVSIEFTGSLSQLARVLQPVIKAETQRVGASLVRT